MLYISGNNIRLTRGDTAYLTVPITLETGDPYEMQNGDTLTLSVKKRLSDTDYCFQKINTGGNTFHITPEDTKNLDFKTYKYDIQLQTESGDVYTIIPVSEFVILEEVTC